MNKRIKASLPGWFWLSLSRQQQPSVRGFDGSCAAFSGSSPTQKTITRSNHFYQVWVVWPSVSGKSITETEPVKMDQWNVNRDTRHSSGSTWCVYTLIVIRILTGYTVCSCPSCVKHWVLSDFITSTNVLSCILLADQALLPGGKLRNSILQVDQTLLNAALFQCCTTITPNAVVFRVLFK